MRLRKRFDYGNERGTEREKGSDMKTKIIESGYLLGRASTNNKIFTEY